MNVKINGGRLRELRREKAIERNELVKRSGVHHATIVRIELGQKTARLSTAKKIAQALEVDHSEFTGDEVVAPVAR